MHTEQRDHQYCTFGDTYIKYRKVVAEWMVDVCDYFKLHATTTHAAIAYLDRLQPNEKFSRFEWQMLAISCILIASKYNECEDHVPDLTTLEDITQQAISNETLLNYELWALKRMGWKLNARTPIAFLSCYMVYKNGLIKDDDVVLASTSSGTGETIEEQHKLRTEASNKANMLANATATACLLNIEYKHFKASDMALAIAHFVREQLDTLRTPVWTVTCVTDMGIVENSIIQEILNKLRIDTVPIPPGGRAANKLIRSKKDGNMTSPTSVDASSPTGTTTNNLKDNVDYEADKENQYTQRMIYTATSM
jgi:hypothetical protein